MQCPQCEPGKDNLRVTCYPLFYAYVDNDDNVIDSEQVDGFTWDNSSRVKCLACGWDGRIQEATRQHGTEKDQTMSTSNRLGEFTYNTYLVYLLEREMRTRAERVGFLDAKQYDTPHNSFEVRFEQEGYEVGWHLGKMYLAKAQEEGGEACHENIKSE